MLSVDNIVLSADNTTVHKLITLWHQLINAKSNKLTMLRLFLNYKRISTVYLTFFFFLIQLN
jgi:hypothetical protein